MEIQTSSFDITLLIFPSILFLGVTPKIRVQTDEVDVIGQETPSLPLLPQLKRRQTRTLEPEDQSEGYETMTTAGSYMSSFEVIILY